MKVAIVGTGMGCENAPYNDKSWEIWTLPGLYTHKPEVERVYEIHSAQTVIECKPPKDKFEWMMENVNVCHPSLKTTFKDARVIDFEGLIEKYGPYFTSSISWMIAEAIEEEATDIALYGVTMSSDNEYGHQKPSVSRLLGWAEGKGIKVHLQKSCELLSAPFVYGYEEKPDFLKSIDDRKKLMRHNLEKTESEVFEAKANYHYTQGCLDEIKRFENNFWASSRK